MWLCVLTLAFLPWSQLQSQDLGQCSVPSSGPGGGRRAGALEQSWTPNLSSAPCPPLRVDHTFFLPWALHGLGWEVREWPFTWKINQKQGDALLENLTGWVLFSFRSRERSKKVPPVNEWEGQPSPTHLILPEEKTPGTLGAPFQVPPGDACFPRLLISEVSVGELIGKLAKLHFSLVTNGQSSLTKLQSPRWVTEQKPGYLLAVFPFSALRKMEYFSCS